ncbi:MULTISPECIES: hypothetical protein [unclassified Brevibacillus]|uniref:DUF6414 family protein n=1 Tax=unclassified Brevibacillus TaxID=2684853 RepID=UPI00156B6502|nr:MULTISPECIES: hypothetical protein [unclassified Brevibacillus]NRQ52005.1 hypothetical protein [Brevibacillus sp. HD1.4A]UED70711.1 hypothetical protein HP435_08770 [Brevibacillus sp. HD3.3A]
MKDVIYLDTSFLHSFMAQINSGLPALTNTEFQESQTSTSAQTVTADSTNEMLGEVSLGEIDIVVFKSPSAKGQYKYINKKGNSSSISLAQLEAGKEIISKQLHDNALTEFEKYLLEKEALVQITIDNNAEIGEYIKLTGSFSVVDLGYFKSVLNKSTFEKFMRNTVEQEMAAALHELERENLNNAQKNSKRKQIKDLYESQKKASSHFHELFETLFEFMESVLPTNSYIKIGKYVAPLKSEFLRESAKEMSFKYGVNSHLQVTLIGKITREYDSLLAQNSPSNDSSLISALQGLSSSVETMLSSMDLLNEGDYIVSPIAIFFE